MPETIELNKMAQARLQSIRKQRIEKVKKLRELGIDPYPARCQRKQTNVQARKSLGKKVALAGRVMAMRGHGKICFFDLVDSTGKIQLWFQKENLGKKEYKILKYFDIGDFIGVEGKVVETKAGEISVDVGSFQFLSKAIRPLPDKWHGLKDIEERYRKRYLDLIMNPSVRATFERKAKFWELSRKFIKSKGFIEIETPILEHKTGGADARPFITHMNALGQDFYLRISTELYQKRLIGGGFEKIYTLGPNFRNEGIDDEHLPEYYQLEWYWAYANYRDNMHLVKQLFLYLARELYGKTRFKMGKYDFDLANKWKEIDYVEIMRKKFSIDVFNSSEKEMLRVIKKHGIQLKGDISKSRLLDNLWKILRKGISGPAFLVNEPKFISPLAKSKKEDPRLTERFHVIIAGRELGNGYSELNDPVDQLERFKEQQSARDKGDEESQMLDTDFVEMLEYGMPPTSGYGQSERVFWTFEGISAREGTLFPTLRYKK